MTLTNRTDFALRALMYLAALKPPATRATSGEIAAAFDISANHLVKVVHELAQAGYIQTSRGVGGGIELAVAPGDIRLGEFIENFQGQVRLHECTSTPGICAIQSFCKLQGSSLRPTHCRPGFSIASPWRTSSRRRRK